MQYPESRKIDSTLLHTKNLQIHPKVHLFKLFVDITALCFFKCKNITKHEKAYLLHQIVASNDQTIAFFFTD